METLISQLISQLNSSVFVLVVILLIVFLSSYKIGKIVERFDIFKENNNKTDKSLDELKTNVAEIQATVKLLYQAHIIRDKFLKK